MKLSKFKQAILALIIANAIWGAAAPIFKWSLGNLHIFTLGFLRFALPMILIMIFFPHTTRIAKKDRLNILGLGFFGIALHISFFLMGVSLTTSINAPIIGSSGPVLIMIGSLFFLKEKFRKKVIIGNLLALLGIITILLQPLLTPTPGESSQIVGNMYLLLSTIASVIALLYAKKIVVSYNPLTLVFWTFFIGVLFFFPFFLKEIYTYGLLEQFTMQGIIGLLFGSIFSSFISYYLLYWSLKYFLAQDAGVFAYIDPVIAMLIAIPLLHEYPTPTFSIGAAFVFLGIYIAEGRLHYHPVYKLLHAKEE